ncbi:MAG: squalene--hopene cyclase [Gemmatimonadota bacterium]|nr:squalene--hopene cyclase [Gemmatimonadota bacterium]
MAPEAVEEALQSDIDRCIARATDSLLAQQRSDGHWVFELEADATIPAEYVLLTHYLGEPEPTLERKIASYLQRVRLPGGGWPLHHAGVFNVSASVKAYFALKAIGDSPSAPHMTEARDAILAHGGAESVNVFTRILLALFGVVSWSAVPVTPVEIMFLPRRFPINLSRISYWGRTVLVPLLVLQALKPLARNPRRVRIDELFLREPQEVGRPSRARHQSRVWFGLFATIDTVLRLVEPAFPWAIRRRAIDRAVAFVRERLNGDSGLGAIFPAMANTVMMFDALGYAHDHPDFVTARKAIDRLLVVEREEAYCQPCVSPVWDTALVCHTLLEVDNPAAFESAEQGLRWLKSRQVLDVHGDWALQRPRVRPGGWAFQYENSHYPDLDDTAAVVLAMHRLAYLEGDPTNAFDEAIERGSEWVVGLQSKNGGWGAFDADNTLEYLNNIPFADHGALLDPPTADVTARCVGMLAQLARASDKRALERGLQFLRNQQREDGSWYGRWGMNYIYGTWSALCALHAAKVSVQARESRRAVRWLLSIQNSDGGWGEEGSSYELDAGSHKPAPSTASQTAWAILGLIAAGEVASAAVERGVAYLIDTQQPDGFWTESHFTATGFPRVFYLRYHGYPKFFPLWALARYRKLTQSPGVDQRFGL